VNYPEIETLSLVDPVPPKATDIGGMGVVDVHKNFGKNILAPWCASGALLCWVSSGVHSHPM
jgi:hypothetical protein